MLIMPLKGFLLGWLSDILLQEDGRCLCVCVGMSWIEFARNSCEREDVSLRAWFAE
jgi:hypothetical protein